MMTANIGADYLVRMNFPHLFQARINIKDLIQTPDHCITKDVSSYVMGDQETLNTTHPVLELSAMDKESRFTISLSSIPVKVKWLTVDGVNVVLPHGGFPTHLEKIHFKNCVLRFVSFGSSCCTNTSYETTPNDPGLKELIMEGCTLYEADKLVFPSSLRKLELSENNTFSPGYPKNIIHCNLDSYAKIPESSNPYLHSLYWYQDLMRKKDMDIKMQTYMETIASSLMTREHCLRLLKLSSSDEPHAVIPCKGRSKIQFNIDMENYKGNREVFLNQNSPPREMIKTIDRIERGKTELQTILCNLRMQDLEFITSYLKNDIDFLTLLTGEGKYVC
jgi:hypothetical protein